MLLAVARAVSGHGKCTNLWLIGICYITQMTQHCVVEVVIFY